MSIYDSYQFIAISIVYITIVIYKMINIVLYTHTIYIFSINISRLPIYNTLIVLPTT